MRKKLLFFGLSLYILFLIGCGPAPDCTNVYYVKPPDWRTPENRDSTIKFYSNFYKGWKIFIDPGHGGEDRHNKGPKKLAIEADLNLFVSLALKDYLEKAGAIVFMSRTIDTTVSLSDRSKMANESGADIFISVHHNAPGKSGDIYTNYTSTYYHATPADPEFEPCNQDIAKYIQRDLAYVMGNSGGLGSFDGTYSDYWIYPKSGFAVLRNTKIPRVLLECSFFTSEYEEQRLIIKEFNEIQAWGIFRGLGKYLRNGVIKLLPLNNATFKTSNPTIKFFYNDDNKGVDTNYCRLLINKKEVNYKYSFDPKEKSLTLVILDNIPIGLNEISLTIKNRNGNHSFPFYQNIEIIN